MTGPTTTILAPPQEGKQRAKEETRDFTFDYSYWTHDGFTTDENTGYNSPSADSNYAGQSELFNDVGGSIMKNAWAGFNTTLLAYGQTGSGKSYSMFGYGENKGLIPMFCEDLFVLIEKKKLETKGIEYKVTYSMLEIYQDKVRDLLSQDGGDNLKVRNHPKLGFYVENLKSIPVETYPEIERLVERGTKSRTVASTRMNATSSRSHTIIVITFAQINKADNTEKRSFVNLVDLAGSERQGDTKSEGKTLKEGANINASLTALGQVISSLVQKQNDPVKNKSMVIPYRNSTLTKLLANSLGGNSKTIMIGAISPAHDAYEGNIFYSNNQDTLSTLRFLDRAKGIKNVAVVNENAIDKLIRELKEENEALKRKLLADGGGGGDDADNDEIKRQIAEQEIAMRELNKTWAQKLEEAMMQKSLMDNDSKEEKKKREKMQTHPHLVNLNEDPLLSGMITHFIENGEHALGRNADATSTEIQLAGLNILPIHGYITRNAKNLILRPANGGQIRVNGKIIEENPDVDGNEEFNGVVLAHNDRVMFGLHQLFLIKFSGVVDGKEYAKITSYRHAQREIAAAEGYGAGDSGVSNALFETISEVLAAVQEANAIAEELMVPKRYVLVINKQDEDGGMGDLVSVKVKDFERHTKWMMSQAQFLEAQQHMKDMYVAYVEGGGLRSLSNWPEDKNPFNITAQDWLIGSGKATFKNLTSAMKIKETILLENQKGANEGLLKFSVEIKIEGLTDVLVSIDQLNQLDEKLRVEIMTESGPVYCKFGIDGLENAGFNKKYLTHETQGVEGNNPKFNDLHKFEPNPMAKVTNAELLEKLGKMQLNYEVYGKYDESHSKSKSGNTLDVKGQNTPNLKRRGTVTQIAGLRSPQSLERLEVKRQETREEVETFLSVVERDDLSVEEKKELLTEQIAKFRHILQLNSEIIKSDQLSASTGKTLQLVSGSFGGSVLNFIAQIEALVNDAVNEADISKISDRAVKELDQAEEDPASEEVQTRVKNRRQSEGFICNLRDIKEDEEHFKGYALEILDKCSDEKELMEFKTQLTRANSAHAVVFDAKMPPCDFARIIVDSLEKRHEIGREAIISLSKWTDDPAYEDKAIPFPNLPQIKKDIAVLLMQKSQAIMVDLRKTESNLMGEISRNIDRGLDYSIDEDDKELQKNRKMIAKQVEALKSNKIAILGTVDALAMAQKQMGEQSSRMDALRNVVQQQADKGAALEKVSRSQATELRNLTGELDRLQILLRTREQEALLEGKAKSDALIEKTTQLGNEMLKAAKIRETTALLKAEIEKLKIMLASAERVNAILMGKETDEKLATMIDEEKVRAVDMAKLKEKVVLLGSKIDETAYVEAMVELSKQLGKLYQRGPAAPVTAKEGNVTVNGVKGDGKVHPDGVKVKEKKGGCVIL